MEYKRAEYPAGLAKTRGRAVIRANMPVSRPEGAVFPGPDAKFLRSFNRQTHSGYWGSADPQKNKDRNSERAPLCLKTKRKNPISARRAMIPHNRA